MSDYLPFVVAGLVTGSVYALAALGLVLTYRTTGLFNFAHGAIGMAVAYAFFQMRTEWGWPTWLSLVLALVVFAPLVGVAIDRWLFGALQDASQAAKVVVTVGLLLLLQGGIEAIFGAQPQQVAPFLPTGTVKIVGVHVGYDQLIVVAASLVVLAVLLVFFRRNRVGVAMRAVVDDRDLVRQAGFSASAISSLTWAMGCMLAGLAGVLFIPFVGLDTITLSLVVVQAIPAAVFGRLVDPARAVAAAFGLGVMASVLLRAFSSYAEFADGLRPSLPFILLFLLLVFARRGSLRELGVSRPWAGMVRTRDVPMPLLVGGLVLAALLLPDARVFVLGIAVVSACSFLSLTVLTGTSGLISLCQAGLAGTGAFAYIHLTADANLPFWVALPIAGLMVVPLGLAIAVPALRLQGLFLALATFGFGLLIDGLLFRWIWFAGGQDGLRGSRPSLLSSDLQYTFFLIAVLALIVGGIRLLRASALGRTLVAMRDSTVGTETLGVNLLWPKLAVFAISAFIAGVSGGLYAGLLQNAGRTAFSSFTSLLWVAVVVVGGVESVLGAVLGGVLLAFAPDLLPSALDEWLVPLFGLGAIVLARQPGGLVALVRRLKPSRLVVVRPSAAATRSGPLAFAGSGGSADAEVRG